MKLNKFNTLSYCFVFLVLIGGAYFKIYNHLLFKLFVPVTTGILGLHFFLKKDITSYLKIGILVLFMGHDSNQYFFILLTAVLFSKKIIVPVKGSITYLYIMFFFGGISYLINQIIEFNIFSFPFFVATFFLPIIFFIISYKYCNSKTKERLKEYYINLVICLAISALIQYLTLGVTADQLTGGTTSAHTLGFHLGVVFILLSSKVLTKESKQLISKIEWILLILIIPLMFLSDAKYLMLNMLLALSVIYTMIYASKHFKVIVITSLLLFVVFGLDVLSKSEIPVSVKSSVDVSFVIDRIQNTAKYELYEKTFLLPYNEPILFLVGSGPGTFLSRAANSRAFDTMYKESSQGGGDALQVDSKLPSFISAHTSWVTHKYAVEYFKTRWYGTLFDYRSSIISLIWEFGIIGFLLFVSFFIRNIVIMKKASKRFKFMKPDSLFIQAFILFYFLNAFLAYYFEYPETQILFWMFLGVFCNKELVAKLAIGNKFVTKSLEY